MIANLKPYPMMKDSGVSRLGDVPEHGVFLRTVFQSGVKNRL